MRRTRTEELRLDGVPLGGEWGPPETDQMPQRYLLQSMTYAMCMDYPRWYVGVLVGGNDLKRYIRSAMPNSRR